MNKREVQAIGDRAAKALRKEFEGTEYTVTYKGGSYGDTYFIMKIEVAKTNANGTAQTQTLSDLLDVFKTYNVDTDWLNKVLVIDRIGKCTLTGYKTRGRKYPFVVTTMDGKRYKVEGRALRSAGIPLPEWM